MRKIYVILVELYMKWTLLSHLKGVSEWLLFNANTAKFSAISWREQINSQWDEDEIRFVLDQHV
jgi:hypothetical protein